MDKNKFRNIHFFTDIDGTMSTEDNFIPSQNIKAIEYFTENGGIFSVATGRCIGDIDILKNIQINGFYILNNGACIFDKNKNKITYKKSLSEIDVVKVMNYCVKNTQLGLVVVNESGYTNAIIDKVPRPFFNDRFRTVEIELIKKPYDKLLLVINDDNADKVASDISKLNLSSSDFVRTGKTSLEIIAKGHSKGKAFDMICKENNIDKSKTFFTGDSFNDIEIMRAVSFSACVDEASPLVKANADVVLCKFSDGIIEKMLEHIEKNL